MTVDADLLRVAAGELEAAAVTLAGVEARPELLDPIEAEADDR